MTHDPRDLIDGYFDETLDSEEQIELSNWIKSDPENARLFAQATLVHDRLRDTLAIGSNEAVLMEPTTAGKSNATWRSWMQTVSLRTAAAVLVLVFALASLWFGIGNQTASAAIRELDRIIVNSMRSKDRTYEIVVEDVRPSTDRRGKRLSRPETQRPPKLPLDGAVLHVRSGNQFVLMRMAADGQPFITGSNGRQSWAINTRGPVKVSEDVNEFNRDLPGHETSIPLTNLHEGLEQLKRAYDLRFSTLGPEEYLSEDGDNVRLLVAVKKPTERGPQRVEIAYESTEGRILSLRFVQMPYGPERLDLRLSLLSEDELPPDFFEHASHHAPDRKVEIERSR